VCFVCGCICGVWLVWWCSFEVGRGFVVGRGGGGFGGLLVSGGWWVGDVGGGGCSVWGAVWVWGGGVWGVWC